MLDHTYFQPGTILWLPKQKHIQYNGYDTSSTVPPKCFGHPVLVLSVDTSGRSAVVLILTSFGGSINIHHKIHYRRHRPHDYLPIHPSSCLIEGAVTLRLRGSQKLARNNWVNVREPYNCPLGWLAESWDENWILPHLSRRIDDDSLRELARYSMSMRFRPDVYEPLTLLQKHTRLHCPYPPPAEPPKASCPRLDNIAPRTVNFPPAARNPSPIGRPFYRDESFLQEPRRMVLSETTPLLPQTRDFSTVIRNDNTTNWRRRSGLVFSVGLGIICGIYVGARWAGAVWKDTILPDLSTVWNHSVTWIKDLFRATEDVL